MTLELCVPFFTKAGHIMWLVLVNVAILKCLEVAGLFHFKYQELNNRLSKKKEDQIAWLWLSR